MDRSSLASSVALVGSVTTTVIAEDVGGWNIAVTADTVNGGPKFEATGGLGALINWVVVAKIVQVIG